MQVGARPVSADNFNRTAPSKTPSQQSSSALANISSEPVQPPRAAGVSPDVKQFEAGLESTLSLGEGAAEAEALTPLKQALSNLKGVTGQGDNAGALQIIDNLQDAVIPEQLDNLKALRTTLENDLKSLPKDSPQRAVIEKKLAFVDKAIELYQAVQGSLEQSPILNPELQPGPTEIIESTPNTPLPLEITPDILEGLETPEAATPKKLIAILDDPEVAKQLQEISKEIDALNRRNEEILKWIDSVLAGDLKDVTGFPTLEDVPLNPEEISEAIKALKPPGVIEIGGKQIPINDLIKAINAPDDAPSLLQDLDIDSVIKQLKDFVPPNQLEIGGQPIDLDKISRLIRELTGKEPDPELPPDPTTTRRDAIDELLKNPPKNFLPDEGFDLNIPQPEGDIDPGFSIDLNQPEGDVEKGVKMTVPDLLTQTEPNESDVLPEKLKPILPKEEMDLGFSINIPQPEGNIDPGFSANIPQPDGDVEVGFKLKNPIILDETQAEDPIDELLENPPTNFIPDEGFSLDIPQPEGDIDPGFSMDLQELEGDVELGGEIDAPEPEPESEIEIEAESKIDGPESEVEIEAESEVDGPESEDEIEAEVEDETDIEVSEVEAGADVQAETVESEDADISELATDLLLNPVFTVTRETRDFINPIRRLDSPGDRITLELEASLEARVGFFETNAGAMGAVNVSLNQAGKYEVSFNLAGGIGAGVGIDEDAGFVSLDASAGVGAQTARQYTYTLNSPEEVSDFIVLQLRELTGTEQIFPELGFVGDPDTVRDVEPTVSVSYGASVNASAEVGLGLDGNKGGVGGEYLREEVFQYAPNGELTRQTNDIYDIQARFQSRFGTVSVSAQRTASEITKPDNSVENQVTWNGRIMLTIPPSSEELDSSLRAIGQNLNLSGPSLQRFVGGAMEQISSANIPSGASFGLAVSAVWDDKSGEEALSSLRLGVVGVYKQEADFEVGSRISLAGEISTAVTIVDMTDY